MLTIPSPKGVNLALHTGTLVVRGEGRDSTTWRRREGLGWQWFGPVPYLAGDSVELDGTVVAGGDQAVGVCVAPVETVHSAKCTV